MRTYVQSDWICRTCYLHFQNFGIARGPNCFPTGRSARDERVSGRIAEFWTRFAHTFGPGVSDVRIREDLPGERVSGSWRKSLPPSDNPDTHAGRRSQHNSPLTVLLCKFPEKNALHSRTGQGFPDNDVSAKYSYRQGL